MTVRIWFFYLITGDQILILTAFVRLRTNKRPDLHYYKRSSRNVSLKFQISLTKNTLYWEYIRLDYNCKMFPSLHAMHAFHKFISQIALYMFQSILDWSFGSVNSVTSFGRKRILQEVIEMYKTDRLKEKNLIFTLKLTKLCNNTLCKLLIKK